jgi:hypothetical protein
MNIFSEDDIFDYIIDNVYMLEFRILDYDKLRKVSSKFNKRFNLKLLYIENKKYNELIHIEGCTYKNILNIIERCILQKFCLDKKNFIIDNILLYSKLHLHLLIITSKLCIYIEYLIELLYNSCYKKHKNIIKIFNNISQNISIYKYSNIHDILNVVGICLDVFKDIDKYYIKQGGTTLCYTLNISIFIFILIKGIYKTLKNNSNHDDIPTELSIKLNKLFIIQNQKLNEYKENFINKNSEINRTFPKYYLKYVMNSLDNFYIII